MRHRRRAALAAVCLLLLIAVVVEAPAEPGRTSYHGAVNCGTTATAIVTANESRVGLAIFNASDGTIYIGSGNPNALSALNGFPLRTHTGLTFSETEMKGAQSCITGSGTLHLRWMETLR